jgi:glycosyltransferase involved in cell wall biosynthesis
MRVALELGLNVEAPRGADVYFHGLVSGLAQLPPTHEYVLFSYFYTDFAGKAARLPQPAAKNFSLAYKRWPESLVRKLKGVGVPIVDRLFVRPERLSLYHGLGGVPPKLSVPTVATIYDLIPEVMHERALNRGEKKAAPPPSSGAEAYRADHVITISAATRDDLIRLYGIHPKKITVVHLGVDHAVFAPADPAAVRVKYGLPKDYFLFVGPFEHRRNAEAGLKALAALRKSGVDASAVLVGKENEHGKSLRALAGSLGISDRVHFTGFVPREDLPGLYSGALAFVHPEHYDGFSLQLLEAMACGAPAVISDAPALTEIAQGDALVCQTAPESVEAALKRFYTEPGLRDAQREASLARAATFSWKRTAAETVAVYEALSASVPARPR